MNKSQMAKLAAAVGVDGVMYDPNAEGVFGNVQGYTVTIMPNANNRVYYMLSLSVSRMGMAPNPADFKPLEKMNKVLSGCTVQRFRVNFLVKLSGNKDKMAEALRSALDTLITFLRTNGYTNCCEHCGRPEGVDAYTVSGKGQRGWTIEEPDTGTGYTRSRDGAPAVTRRYDEANGDWAAARA